jgi:hypothetical protein
LKESFEAGAEVFITDNTGNKFEFEEQITAFISISEFKVIPDRNIS